MKIIELTSLEGKKVIVNIDKIEVLQPLSVNHTNIQLSTTAIIVRESVAVIQRKLNPSRKTSKK